MPRHSLVVETTPLFFDIRKEEEKKEGESDQMKEKKPENTINVDVSAGNADRTLAADEETPLMNTDTVLDTPTPTADVLPLPTTSTSESIDTVPPSPSDPASGDAETTACEMEVATDESLSLADIEAMWEQRRANMRHHRAPPIAAPPPNPQDREDLKLERALESCVIVCSLLSHEEIELDRELTVTCQRLLHKCRLGMRESALDFRLDGKAIVIDGVLRFPRHLYTYGECTFKELQQHIQSFHRVQLLRPEEFQQHQHQHQHQHQQILPPPKKGFSRPHLKSEGHSQHAKPHPQVKRDGSPTHQPHNVDSLAQNHEGATRMQVQNNNNVLVYLRMPQLCFNMASEGPG
jgi:hypothetical protein